MSWIVYDPASFRVLRIDQSATQPDGVTSAFSASVSAWPVAPSSASRLMFRSGNLAWEDSRTLFQQQLSKWAEIKAARTAVFDAPLVTIYGIFDSDAESRRNIFEVVQRAQLLTSTGQPVVINFTLADNTVIVMDLAMAVAVGLALGAKVQSARATATALRTTLFNTVTTVSQVDAVAWPV